MLHFTVLHFAVLHFVVLRFVPLHVMHFVRRIQSHDVKRPTLNERAEPCVNVFASNVHDALPMSWHLCTNAGNEVARAQGLWRMPYLAEQHEIEGGRPFQIFCEICVKRRWEH